MTFPRLRPATWLTLGVGAFLLTVAVGQFAPRPLQPVLGVASLVPLCVGAAMHWKRLDEPAKAAHRWAWYWGGSVGLVIAFLGAIVLAYTPQMSNMLEAWLATFPAPRRLPAPTLVGLAFAGGAAFTALVQTAAFVFTWAGWWAAKR